MDKKIVKKKRKMSNDEIKLQGIFQEGYGIIPKMVMKDKRLTIEAKSIYALLCSYAGRGNTAFPSIETQCYYLNISERRYLKHRKLLVDTNYISIESTREIIEYEDGSVAEVRGKNIYTIISDPVKEIFVCKEENKIKKSCKRVNKPISLNSQNVSVDNVGIQNVSLQNDTINNNNHKNINTNKNIIKNNKNTTSINASSIEERTILKLTPYQIKLVSGWEHSRILKSIDIFNNQNGTYFSLLRKIYYDANNFKSNINVKSFNNFEGRNYSDDYYNDLGDKLSGLK